MIVVDGDQVRRHQRPGVRACLSRRVRPLLGGHSLHGGVASGADLHADLAHRREDPVENVVVVADRRDRAHDEFDGRRPGVGLVEGLGVAPERRTRSPLENADGAPGHVGHAGLGGHRRMQKGCVPGAIDARLQARGQLAETVFSDVHE